ncbi:MAG: glycosyltransferase family 2 protein [Gemmataceae bacterium]
MTSTIRLRREGQVSAPKVRLSTPALSVVIVNYRQWDEATRLVEELERSHALDSGQAEIVVVDNHSPADRQGARLRRRPSVSLRRWERNRGYASAINEAARLSLGGWLLVLNPDIALPDGFMDGVLELARKLERDEPRTGIVGFPLRNADGSRQDSVGRLPTLLRVLGGLAWPRTRRKYVRVQGNERREVPWVTGCCLLVRHDCLRQLGGFDEDFFLYYEDVDLCQRARALGWSVQHEPALRAAHLKPLQQRALTAPLHLCTRHALLTYAAKHWPRWQVTLLAGIVKAESWYRQARARLRGNIFEACHCAELRRVVDDVLAIDFAAARQRVEEALNSR